MGEYRITLGTLLDGLAECGGRAGLAVGGLALDSRNVRPGDAFVALAGASGHGIEYAAGAAQAGAVVIFYDGSSPLPENCPLPVITVPGLADKLAMLAQRMWDDPAAGLDLVAVTGTNGKTSVAWLLAQALDGAMIGTLGYGRPGRHRTGSMTTPDLLSVYRTLAELRDAGIETVVLEASSHALAQNRLAGLSFTSVIFTNLGHDHLDYHAGRADYGKAKARLFTDSPHQRRLINLDDEFGAELFDLPGESDSIGYSIAGASRASVTAKLVAADMSGLQAEIQLGDDRLSVRSLLLGRVNLWNLAIVAAELAARGTDGDEIVRRIAALEPVPGRMQPIPGDGGRLAVIDYAHTPDALERALSSLHEITDQKLWCVFGCGGDRDRGKRPRMGRIAESLADHVVLTDDNPRSEDGMAIIRAIQSGMEKPHRSRVIRDRGRAITQAIAESEPGDVVLVAGKGHETEQVMNGERQFFDDARAARQALEVAA